MQGTQITNRVSHFLVRAQTEGMQCNSSEKMREKEIKTYRFTVEKQIEEERATERERVIYQKYTKER